MTEDNQTGMAPNSSTIDPVRRHFLAACALGAAALCHAIVSRTDIAYATRQLQHSEQLAQTQQGYRIVTIPTPMTQTVQRNKRLER
jgi:hypothetical protein